MTKRDKFLEYVRNGGDVFCSPQIGGGAGFDTRLAGKEWVSETNLNDTMTVIAQFDIIPLLNVGLCDLGECNPALAWKEKVDKDKDRITREYFLNTPKGVLSKKSVEEKYSSAFNLKYPVENISDLDIFEYYLDVALDSDFSRAELFTREICSFVAGRAAVSIQWPVQPYELLCFPDTVHTVLLASDCPEKFLKLMDKILVLDEKLMAAVAKGGADFIFLGGPGVEMLSPQYYQRYIIPYSQQVSETAHRLGLMVYAHICSPIEPFLSMGFYNQMGIDLFETLSPPPVGNVQSLKDALEKIDRQICTRGNLGLDALINDSPEIIREKTLRIIEETKGRKHIIAASDYLVSQVPAENIIAMADAVRGKLL